MKFTSYPKPFSQLYERYNQDKQNQLGMGIPFLLLSHFSFVVLFILGRFGQEYWMIILGLSVIQTLVGLFFYYHSAQPEKAKFYRYGMLSMQCFVAVIAVLLSGGYPSPFWLTFPLCSMMSSIMLNHITGLYIITFLTALSLGIPHLTQQTGLTDIAVISAQAIFTLTAGLVVRKMASLFLQEREKQKGTEKALREANDMLAVSVAQLERRAHETALLTEFGSTLQSCANSEESYQVMKTFFAKLFPYDHGAIYLYRPSHDELEAIVDWGDYLLNGGEQEFDKDDCWALRRGQLYRLDDPSMGLVCRHVKYPPQTQYLCIPLTAQGETLGILHIQSQKGAPTLPINGMQSRIDAVATLAEDVADYIALAIANQQLRETLRIQSIRDPLSSLYNRRYMEETLEREIRQAKRQEKPLGVIMLDIDHFKAFNDQFGHDAGDIAISELGSYLKSHIRGSDVACRYGGEEFLIILPNTTIEKTQQRAEELRSGIKQLPIKQYEQLLNHITVSIGIAIYPDMGNSKVVLLKSADNALYKAKAQGRDCTITADVIT